MLLGMSFEDLYIVHTHFIDDKLIFCFCWLNTLRWLMQVPENFAARDMADSIVEAWKLYGKTKLVH